MRSAFECTERWLQIWEMKVEVDGLEAAVDLEHLPGDEARRVRRQVQRGDCDVIDRAAPCTSAPTGGRTVA